MTSAHGCPIQPKYKGSLYFQLGLHIGRLDAVDDTDCTM
jgi:hypothetical protein